MKKVLLLALAASMVFAAVSPAPAHEDDDIANEAPKRFVPRPAGVEKDITFYYGPFTIPPGQDMNRVTIDLPYNGGFYTQFEPDLVDAVTGEEPPHDVGHTHHAHWFRVASDPDEEYYANLGVSGLSWVFGTGEEQTRGDVDARSAAENDRVRYGIYIEPGEPQALIYMLHNKTAQTQNWYVALRTRFVYGDAASIAAADGCGPVLLEGEACAAGATMRHIHGVLWGRTFDVPRQPLGDDTYVYPTDPHTGSNGIVFTAGWSGTAIGTAGHLHPSGKEVVMSNLGPAKSGCEADIDGDGFPGVTIFRSDKLEAVPDAFPHSEEYQMEVTPNGWRAPIRAGDRIAQFGVYANKHVASYEAMSYAGIYTDREQVPAPLPAGYSCTAAGFDGAEHIGTVGPVVVDDPAADPLTGYASRPWEEPSEYCGVNPSNGHDFGVPCDRPEADRGPGMETTTVHIAGFVYLPGDRGLPGALGAPPRVPKGEAITFVNEDTGGAIRHSVTSCPWPCNGPYVANYPLPDGDFDSGKLGNLDYIDGGLTGDDTVPVWSLDTGALSEGMYSYYCRIHPWMRGAFEVTA